MSGIMRFPARGAAVAPRLGGSPAITSTTGYPWEDGDVLYADDLNAAFLPISGGTVTGPLYWIATGSTAPRSAQDRSHDWINVLDFGAELDGTTLDDAAYAAARSATGFHGEIFVPRGIQNIDLPPTGGPSGPVLWRMDGVTIDGVNPVNGMGTDVVENFFGPKFFGRTNSFAGCGPVLRVDQVLNHAGGTAGNTNVALAVNANSSGTSPEGVYGINATLGSTKSGAGDQVAVSGFTTRRAGAGFLNMWGANFYAADTTGASSSVGGSLVGAEVSVNANGADDYTTGIRSIVDCVASLQDPAGADVVVKYGVRVYTNGPSNRITIDRHYTAYGQCSHAGYSTEFLTQMTGANAIWLATGHRIALDNAGTGGAAHLTLSGNGTVATLAGGGFVVTPGATGNGYNVAGSAATGLITTGATFSIAAIQMAADQKINFEATQVISLSYVSASGYATLTAPLNITTPSSAGTSLRFSVLPQNAATDAAAAGLGVPIGGIYRNASALMVRVA